MAIFINLLALTIVILIHELGHLSMMKLFRVPVKETIIGIGPKLFRWRTIEIRLIPFLGGYTLPVSLSSIRKRWHGVLIAYGGLIAQWVVVLVIALTRIARIPVFREFSVDFVMYSMFSLIYFLPFRNWDGKLALRFMLGKDSKNQRDLIL